MQEVQHQKRFYRELSAQSTLGRPDEDWRRDLRNNEIPVGGG